MNPPQCPIRAPRRARTIALTTVGLLAGLLPAVGMTSIAGPPATAAPATTSLSGVVVGVGAGAGTGVSTGVSTALGTAEAERKPRKRRYWKYVATEQFNRLDPRRWGKFSGTPGCCPDARWDPSMVGVRQGKLLLHTAPRGGQWLSGGVGGWNWTQGTRKYGRWDARIRFDRGQGVSAAALLWPTNNGWPPELDFYEIFETWGSRQQMSVTTHWRAQGEHRFSQRRVRRDFSRWHVASVRWTRNHVAYFLDGRRIKIDRNRPKIPKTRMWVGFQTHAHRINGRYPAMPEGRGSVALAVDWVRVYKRNR